MESRIRVNPGESGNRGLAATLASGAALTRSAIAATTTRPVADAAPGTTTGIALVVAETTAGLTGTETAPTAGPLLRPAAAVPGAVAIDLAATPASALLSHRELGLTPLRHVSAPPASTPKCRAWCGSRRAWCR